MTDWLANAQPIGAIPNDEPDDDWLTKAAKPLPSDTTLDRLKGAIFGQESRGNYQVHPNQRTHATGGYQVLPGNIPSWTKKHLGKTLTPQQFAADPDAQDKVFAGEMGEYVNRARQMKPDADEDTIARMAAAAWYGGPGSMHKYDVGKRFRPNEPSFREYTTSVLNRMNGGQTPKPIPKPNAKGGLPALAESDPDAYQAALAKKYPQFRKDAPGAMTFEPPAADTPDWLANAQPLPPTPVPESPETLKAQVASAQNPQSPRGAVLVTPGEKPPKATGLKLIDTPQGKVLVNPKKPVTDLDTALGTVDPVSDTSQGLAVVAKDKKGNELESKIVGSPEAADAQAQANLAMHGDKVKSQDLLPAQDAVASRLGVPKGVFSPATIEGAVAAGEFKTKQDQRAKAEARRQAIIQRNVQIRAQQQQTTRPTGQDAAFARGKFGKMTREQRSQPPARPSMGAFREQDNARIQNQQAVQDQQEIQNAQHLAQQAGLSLPEAVGVGEQMATRQPTRREEIQAEIEQESAMANENPVIRAQRGGTRPDIQGEVERRYAAEQAEGAKLKKLMESRTPEEIEQMRADVADLINSGRISSGGKIGLSRSIANTDTAGAGVLKGGHDLAYVATHPLEAYFGGLQEAPDVGNLTRQAQLRREVINEAMSKMSPSQLRDITAFAAGMPLDIATLAAFSKIPLGGPTAQGALGFGLHSGAMARGEDKPYSEVAKETGKGALTGALFGGTHNLPALQRGLAVGGGSIATDVLAGDKPNAENAVANALFAVGGRGVKEIAGDVRNAVRPAERAPLTPRPELLPEMPPERSTNQNPPAAPSEPAKVSSAKPQETAPKPSAAAGVKPSVSERQWETKLGVVTEAANQTGVPEGYRRVVKPDGQDGMLRWADVEKGRAKEIGTDEPLNFAPRKAVSASPEGVTLEDGTVVPHIWRPDAEIAPAAPQTAGGASVHPIRPDIATTPLPPETAAGVDNRQRLLDLGYSEAEISSMKPRQQANIAGAGQRKGEAAPPVAGNEKLTPEVRQQLTDAGYREQEISQMTPDRATQALEFVKELDAPRTEKRLEDRRQTTRPVETEQRIGPRRIADGPRVDVDGKPGTIATTEGGLATVKLDDGGTIVVGERGLKPLKEAPAEPLPTAPVQGDAAKPSEPPRPTEPPSPPSVTEASEPTGIRRHGETMRRAGLDAPDVAYDPQSVPGWKKDANATIDELGVDDAIKHYKELPDGDEGGKYSLGDALLDRLTPGTEQYTDLARHQIIHAGEAGQTLRAAAEVARRDPANAVKYAEMASQRVRKGKGLTPEEARRIQGRADRQIVAEADAARLDTALDTIEKKGRPRKAKPTTLLSRIRSMGGILPDKNLSGELARLGKKESGKSGLVNPKADPRTNTVERMAQSLYDEGYLRDVPDIVDANGKVDVRKFLDAVEAEASGQKINRHVDELADVDMEAWEKHELNQQQEAEYEKRLGFLEDPEVQMTLELLAKDPKSTEAIEDLHTIGAEHGLSKKAIERTIRQITEPEDTSWLAENAPGRRSGAVAGENRVPEKGTASGFDIPWAERPENQGRSIEPPPKTRSGKTSRKVTYEVRLKARANEALNKLKGRTLDFGGAVAVKPGEKGAVGENFGQTPLKGDLETVAEYVAGRLSKMKSTAALTKDLVDTFGKEIEPHVTDVRNRAYRLRAEERAAEVEMRPERRQSILGEIRKEIQDANKAIGEYHKDAAKMEAEVRRAARDDVAQSKYISDVKQRTNVLAEKVRTRLEKADNARRLRDLATEARERKAAAAKELTQAREAEMKAHRERLATERTERKAAGRWDVALRQVATEARERLTGNVDPKDAATMEDLVSVGTEKFLKDSRLPTIAAISPGRFYREMGAEFPNLTARQIGKIYRRSLENARDATKAAAEVAQLRGATKESQKRWEKFWDGSGIDGEDISAQAILIQRAAKTKELLKIRTEQQQELNRLNRSKAGVIWDDWIHGPTKSLRSTIDSMLLRQGLQNTILHPIITAKTAIPGTRGYWMSKGSFERAMRAIESHPRRDMAETMGVDLPAVEEQFQHNIASSLPHVRLSEQAATLQMTGQRLGMVDHFAKLGEAAGYTPENNPEFYKQAGRIINLGTGRGDLDPATLRGRIASASNRALFSGKLAASRFQLINDVLNPITWYRSDPVLRKYKAVQLLKLGVLATGTYAAANAMGLPVGVNPFEEDFGKLRWGNTRYDLTGGEGAAIRLVAMLAMLAYNTSTGEKLPYGQDSPWPILGKQLRYKLGPVPGLAYDTTYGGQKNPVGEDIQYIPDPKDIQGTLQRNALWNLVSPMVMGDFVDGWADSGLQGMLKNIPALGGLGIQTYPDRVPKPVSRATEAKRTREAHLPPAVRERQAAVKQERKMIRAQRAKRQARISP